MKKTHVRFFYAEASREKISREKFSRGGPALLREGELQFYGG